MSALNTNKPWPKSDLPPLHHTARNFEHIMPPILLASPLSPASTPPPPLSFTPRPSYRPHEHLFGDYLLLRPSCRTSCRYVLHPRYFSDHTLRLTGTRWIPQHLLSPLSALTPSPASLLTFLTATKPSSSRSGSDRTRTAGSRRYYGTASRSGGGVSVQCRSGSVNRVGFGQSRVAVLRVSGVGTGGCSGGRG